jgi:gluconate 5-dehydrogenase
VGGEATTSLLDSDWLDRLAPEQLFSLRGRVALITGAAGGIGRWLCAGFGAAGAAILASDIDEGGLESLAHELRARDVTIQTLVVDLARDDAPELVTRETVTRLGRLDVLVNNAGINRRLPMLEVDVELLRHIWEVDFIRCYQLSQAAARIMVGQGGGSIIHIGSLNNHVGLEDVSMLGPTKAALSQLAKGMTIEFGRFGIRTNTLAPGFMDTPMNASHWTHETRAPWIFDRVPMSRPGHPAELVGTALLMASPAGSFLSGQTIYVDGGFTAGSRWNVPPGTGVAAYQEWRAAGSPIREFSPVDRPDEGR